MSTGNQWSVIKIFVNKDVLHWELAVDTAGIYWSWDKIETSHQRVIRQFSLTISQIWNKIYTLMIQENNNPCSTQIQYLEIDSSCDAS